MKKQDIVSSIATQLIKKKLVGIVMLNVLQPDSDDAIYFHFFEIKEEAEEYSSEGKWNILLYLYSIIAAEQTWITTKTYNNIAIDYTDYYIYTI